MFAMSAQILWHYQKWLCPTQQHRPLVIDVCLLYQDLNRRNEILAGLQQLGLERDRIHLLGDDGVRDPDIYVDRWDGGIGTPGAFAVPNLEGKHLYLFDNLSVTADGKPVARKQHELMRLLAGIPRQSGVAVLFDAGDDRLCFSRHCIRTLDGRHRDAVIREVVAELREQEREKVPSGALRARA